MSSIEALRRRAEKLAAHVEQQQEAENDVKVLALINAALMISLSQMRADGTFPDDYTEQEYTPAEQAIVDRFARRYSAERVKQELLQELGYEGDTAA